MISISKAPNAKMQVLSGNGCCLSCWQIEMEMSSYLSLNKALPFSLAHHHSCFLLCKQLVQAVHPIPPVFLKVKHHQTVPFWRHEKLIPLIPLETGMEVPIVTDIWRVVENAEDRNEFKDEEFNDELDSNIIDTASSAIVTGMMFDEHVEEQVELLHNFGAGAHCWTTRMYLHSTWSPLSCILCYHWWAMCFGLYWFQVCHPWRTTGHLSILLCY